MSTPPKPKPADPPKEGPRVVPGGTKDDNALANELILKYGLQRLLYSRKR